MTDMLDFATGAQDAEQLVKDESEARKAARGGASYFSLKDDGDLGVLRFLIPHTQWIYVKQHDFIDTKPAPSDKPTDRDWPQSVGSICRYTLIGPKDNRRPAFDECYVCDNVQVVKNGKKMKAIPTLKIWTLAASRQSLIGDEKLVEQGRIHPSQVGKKVIIDDAELVEETDDQGNMTGRKVWRKKIYIVNQSVRNFFSPLITVAGLHGTITDRDYAIVRKGAARSNKVDYEAIDLGPYDVIVPKEDGSTEQIRYDTQDPRIAAMYEGHGIDELTLRKIINRRIGKDYYNFYFDPRVAVAWKDYYDNNEDEAAATATAEPTAEQQAGNVATAEPTEGVSAEKLEALRRQVMESAGGAATPAAAEPAVPVPPVATAAPVVAPAPAEAVAAPLPPA